MSVSILGFIIFFLSIYIGCVCVKVDHSVYSCRYSNTIAVLSLYYMNFTSLLYSFVIFL